jgi:hypothetical protein
MKRSFCISTPQLFWLIFAYVLGGLMLHCGGDFASALFACLFSVCLCVIASALCLGRGSFSESMERFPAGVASAVRWVCAFFLGIPISASLISFSGRAAAYYESASPYAVLALLAVICVFTVRNGFSAAARFAETLALPLAILLMLSLLGGRGDGMSLDFATDELFGGGLVIGSAAVFFSLYLRCTAEGSPNMSRFAKNSAFHPSPLACGIVGVLSATAVYFWLCFAGASGILASFFSWFLCVGRLFTLCISACDILSLPEAVGISQKTRRVTALLAICFVQAAFYGTYSSVFGAAAMIGNVLIPCAAWAFSFVMLNKKTPV